MSRRQMNLMSSVLATAAMLLLALGAQAAPSISSAQVVDVTPFGFSVVWEASEPSTPGIQIFSDSGGLLEITSQFEITPFPIESGDPAAADPVAQGQSKRALRAASRALGLMRVRVHGGIPSTTYYYQVSSEAAGETTSWPAGVPAPATTSSENSFVAGSHQLLVSFASPDARGWIVTAESPEASYPISGVAGDGAAQNEVFLNLGRLHAVTSGNWQPDGTTSLTISVRKGADSIEAPSFDLDFESDFTVGLAYLIDFTDLTSPLITLVDPADAVYTNGESILVTWVDDFPAADGEIALYYDSDETGQDGTLITTGLAEVPDGVADGFDWDTVGVPDGAYFIYAVVSNATTSDVSYALGEITIDRNGTDGDADMMSDLWERFYLGGTASTGGGDLDLDGSREVDEYRDQTDPGVPDVRLALEPGLNFISFPIDFSPAIDSAQLLLLMGGAATAISRVDTATDMVETTEWVAGAAEGDVFPIQANEGYHIRLAADHEAIWQGLATPSAHDLEPGVNFTGFSSVPVGYDAHQLMTAIGGPAVVSSISRLDLVSGRFDTASYDGVTPSGSNFAVERGVAYLISMKALVSGFSP